MSMRGAVAAALVAVLLLGGCNDAVPPPGTSNIDVDTPELRQLKADAGIETCVPGPGGGELPALTLACLGGGPDVDLSSLKGPLLINLWYSACEPCRDEMPALQSFYVKHGDRVGVIGVDVENYPGAALEFADIVGATYAQLADPGGEIFDQADLRLAGGFPQSLLVDADGALAHQTTGEFKSLEEIESLVEEHLGVTL